MAALVQLVQLCVLVLACASACQCVSFVTGSKVFEDWCASTDRHYGTLEELTLRKAVFYNNLRHIQLLNTQYKDREVVFAVNQFADRTAAEFKATVLMSPRPSPIFQHFSGDVLVKLPGAFDWRSNGSIVTEVKDQGSVGSCWAFSTVGNVEGQWALATGKLTSLSAEQLVDCDSTQDPHNVHADCGVFGGWPYLAYQYIQQTGGIEPESSYPYCSGFGKCFPCQAPGYNKTRCGPPVPPTSCQAKDSCQIRLDKNKFVAGLKLNGWVAIKKNESVIASELVTRGPLSIAINAQLLQFYHSGVWDPIGSCDPTILDHAVLIVGYGTSNGFFSKPYWTIKNSWGSKWGEKGYFRMVRGKGKCGVDQQVTSALLQ